MCVWWIQFFAFLSSFIIIVFFFFLSSHLSSLFLSFYLSLLNYYSVLFTLTLWPVIHKHLQIEFLRIVNKWRLSGSSDIGLVHDYNNIKYSSIFYPLFFPIITYMYIIWMWMRMYSNFLEIPQHEDILTYISHLTSYISHCELSEGRKHLLSSIHFTRHDSSKRILFKRVTSNNKEKKREKKTRDSTLC